MALQVLKSPVVPLGLVLCIGDKRFVPAYCAKNLALHPSEECRFSSLTYTLTLFDLPVLYTA
jgi:hypothetical protein